MGFYIFIIIITFAFIVTRTAASSNRRQEKASKTFWQNEHDANFARRRDISDLSFINIDLNRLDTDALDHLSLSTQKAELLSLSAKKIVNLSAYTNTDLKLMYGPANLEELSEYDMNYTTLIRLLNSIAKKLSEINETTLATSYLEYAVEIGSDITETYVLLGSIYKSLGKDDKLSCLIKTAKDITSLSGPVIVTKLNNIK